MDHTIKTEKAPNPVGNYPHARKWETFYFYLVLDPENQEQMLYLVS